MPSPKLAARTIVRVSNDAFLSMCFSAADAAIVAPDFNRESYRRLAAWDRERDKLPIREGPLPPSVLFSETGCECGGVGWGEIKRSKNQTVISLEWASTTLALMADDGLTQSGASSLLLDDLAVAAGKPFGTVVACFHTHPLLTASPRDVMEKELYAPSGTDINGPAYPNSAVSLVVSVAWPDKSKSKPADQPGLVCRWIGDFNFFVTAHLPGSRNWCATDPALEIQLD